MLLAIREWAYARAYVETLLQETPEINRPKQTYTDDRKRNWQN